MTTHDFTDPDQRRGWADQLLALAPGDDDAFGSLAGELFAYQFANCPPYRRVCEARAITPDKLEDWRCIPAVPQQLFKDLPLYCHGEDSPLPRPAERIFHTSGTTTGQPGKQHLLDESVYKAVAVNGARQAGLFGEDLLRLHFLAPPPREARHSSLSTMFDFWCTAFAHPESAFWVRGEKLMLHGLRERLEMAALDETPVGLCGAAFSFVHYIDAYSRLDPIALPAGSFLLETGGFKGRSREMPKVEFYQALSYLFGLEDNVLWNEYGMTELSSQAYAHGANGLHQPPPWARVLVIDPEAENEVAVGESGLVRWMDLANIDSVGVLQTLDQAVRHERGFFLVGRLPDAEQRGCSLDAEDYQPEIW